jgi:hypothetical protein
MLGDGLGADDGRVHASRRLTRAREAGQDQMIAAGVPGGSGRGSTSTMPPLMRTG